jgi:sn-glycerol 3-phosphate transport system ATP-binding protein
VTLGVRPEHLHPTGDAAATFQVQVQLVETLGADSLAHGTLAGNGEALTVRLPGGTPLREGQSLSLAADPGELHFFDPDSGQRLADL